MTSPLDPIRCLCWRSRHPNFNTARDGTAIITDPRNPLIGTRLVREWDGVEHTVTVMKDGFDWQGRKFKSLSAAAKAITGTQWNGYRFFGLRERKQEQV